MAYNISVLGAGAFGLALADYLARNGKSVTVWDRNIEVLATLEQTRTVDRPRGLIINSSIHVQSDLKVAVGNCEMIVSAVPSFAVAEICRRLVQYEWSGKSVLFVNCSKGIDQDGLFLPCEAFESVMGSHPSIRYGVLAGPSHAEEVARDVPTAVVCAAIQEEDAQLIQSVFNSNYFRVYTQTDVVGVELGGALKNVMAIALGVCDGRGFGDNTKAALITRGVAEIARLAKAKGAHAETAAGLSGLGDLIVTAMSKHSRNRGFGELIAHGDSPDIALDKIGAVVEGYKSAKSAWLLALKHAVDMPIVTAVYKALYEELPIDDCIGLLLDRQAKPEKLS